MRVCVVRVCVCVWGLCGCMCLRMCVCEKVPKLMSQTEANSDQIRFLDQTLLLGNLLANFQPYRQ